MPSFEIRGVPVEFPFEPYDIQKDYMEKVIECLQEQTNGVLESPTGTGKTLSLLCASLAWLQMKKAQVQAQRLARQEETVMQDLLAQFSNKAGKAADNGRAFLGLPTIIYASRTHSQLSQAMQELKRTSYNYMKANVLGSREQMCINPEVLQESGNLARVQMCRLKVKSRTCQYYNRVDKKREEPAICDLKIIDIEDMVKLGNTHKFCPYYMSGELQRDSDIVFMPYNYLLDPKVRRGLKINLANNIVILDEAHNIEKICEDAASLQVKSTDITLAIEEVTAVMKAVSADVASFNSEDVPKDFTEEELCVLKQMLLDFESALDTVELKGGSEGTTFDGNFIYELFSKAGIQDNNFGMVCALIDKICQFLVTASEGPFQKRGVGVQLFSDLMTIAFSSTSPQFKDKVQRCYKVHIVKEEPPKRRQKDNWLTKITNPQGRILNYWCFSPGFGMNMLMDTGVRCVILTSGTLAPLRPLISELELPVTVRLENPHVVKGDQVCVKIISKGPDQQMLNCNYQNRENPQYINSLGMTITNLTKCIPHGMLIFFPSYPLMQKFQQFWQQNGIWSQLSAIKPIYVEPKEKEAFQSAMSEFYAKVQDPAYQGAIFMGVCRGKVSEGLDFADGNGRAVIVTGLPYPPLKDPRVILKKRYLDLCNAKDKEFLRGDDWYSLEATRAVNQAIGRVIRHRHDYGAILLLDSRFDNFRIKSTLSMWLREHIQVVNHFGEIIRDLRNFYKVAASKMPEPRLKPLQNKTAVPAEFDTTAVYRNPFASSSSIQNPNGEVRIHKRNLAEPLFNIGKKKKLTLLPNNPVKSEVTTSNSSKEYLIMVKKTLDKESYDNFVKALALYRNNHNFTDLRSNLDTIFLRKPQWNYILLGLETYILKSHKQEFRDYLELMK